MYCGTGLLDICWCLFVLISVRRLGTYKRHCINCERVGTYESYSSITVEKVGIFWAFCWMYCGRAGAFETFWCLFVFVSLRMVRTYKPHCINCGRVGACESYSSNLAEGLELLNLVARCIVGGLERLTLVYSICFDSRSQGWSLQATLHQLRKGWSVHVI